MKTARPRPAGIVSCLLRDGTSNSSSGGREDKCLFDPTKILLSLKSKIRIHKTWKTCNDAIKAETIIAY